MAITRQVSSNTLAGLSEQVSLALEDKQGINEAGKLVRLTGDDTGTKETDVLGFTWGQSTEEVTQKMTINISNLLAQAFTGVAATSKAQLLRFRDTSGYATQTTVSLSLGSISTSFVMSAVGVGEELLKEAVAIRVATSLNSSTFSSLVESAVVSGSTVNVTYTLSAGNISAPTVTATPIGGFIESLLQTVNPVSTLRQPVIGTEARTITAYAIDTTAGDTGTLTPYTSKRLNLNILKGNSLTRSSLINLAEGIFDLDGITSVTTSGTVMTLTMDSGYSFGGVKLEVLIDPTDGSSRLFGEDFTAVQTTAHIAAVAETNGTLRFTLYEPVAGQSHDVAVLISPTDGTASIASKIVSGINNHVYNADGGKITDYVTASPSNIDNSAGTFDITLTWHETGVVTTISDATIIDRASLDGTALATVTVSRSTEGTEYVLNEAPDWDSVSTSSVLQPGGETTHFATLIKYLP